MSKLLFDEQPLVVDRKLAKVIGLNEAIVVQQVHYWITINKKANKNFHEGKYWAYNSLPNWHKNNFDFWSFDTVKRTFSKLVKANILITGNFNKDKRDRTLWYSIDYKRLETIINGIGAICTDGDEQDIPNASGQNAPMEKSKMHRPLPENNITEIKTENNNNSSNFDVATIDDTLSVAKESKTNVVVDDKVNQLAKKIKPQIEQTVGKITHKRLIELIQTAGVDEVIKQLDNFPKFKEVQNIMNPVGFFIRAVIEGWSAPVPLFSSRGCNFSNFEQHEYTDADLEALFEPIGDCALG